MKQVAVIGLGLFGATVSRALAERGVEVIAIDSEKELVQKIKDDVAQAVLIDATDPESLKAVGVKEVDVAVVAIGKSIESSVLATAVLRNLEVRRIVARAVTPLHAQILREIGANQVVFPEQDLGRKVANQIIGDTMLEYISLSEDYIICEVPAREDFIGKTLNDIRFRNKYKVTVVAMRQGDSGDLHQQTKLFYIPDPGEEIRPGSILVLAGKKTDVEKLR